MAFRLYSSACAYLLMPDCLLASRAAERSYGKLRYLGAVEPDALTMDELVGVWRQIDEASYAVIEAELAARIRSTHALPG